MSTIRYKIVVSGITYGVDNLPYTNANFGIVSGVWTIHTYEDDLIEARNAISQINISKGGNIASGYTFGFSFINDGFSDEINDQPIFFENRPVQLYSIIDSVEELQWTGIVKDFTIKETNVMFSCTDSIGLANGKMGSNSVPICFNRNKNCKVIKSSELEESKFAFKSIAKTIGSITYTEDLFYTFAFINTGSNNFHQIVCEADSLPPFSENGYYLRIISGKGFGALYKVLKYAQDGLNPNRIIFTLDADNTELISDFSSLSEYNTKSNVTCIALVTFDIAYTLSQDQVNSIEDVRFKSGLFEKSLIEGTEYKQSTTSTEIITVYNFNEEEKVNVGSDESITATVVSTNENGYQYPTGGSYGLNFTISIDSSYNKKIIDYIKNGIDLNIFFGKIRFKNIFTLDNLQQGTISIRLFSTYKGDQIANTVLIYDSGTVTATTDNMYTDNLDLIIDINKETFPVAYDDLSFNFYDYEQIQNFNMNLYFDINTGNAGDIVNPYVLDYVYDQPILSSRGEFEIEDVLVDCKGQNVTGSNDYESPSETIKYIQTNYAGIPIGSIDTTSYTQATDDYNQMQGATLPPNLGKQINDSEDINSVIKEMCYHSILGLYMSRDGNYTLENFLVNSIAYNNTITPDAVLTEQNFIDISDIKQDDLNTTITEIEVLYDYNDVTDEYQKTILVTPSRSVGINANNQGITDQIQELLQAGLNRTAKANKLKLESKQFKYITSEVDALNWIRNIATHVNRPHQYLTITLPITSTNLALDLLSFISVRDLKITDNIERLGWVVKREIDIKNSAIKLTLLLDISATDPFLVLINAIQDDDNIVDILIDDDTAIDIIEDGDGA